MTRTTAARICVPLIGAILLVPALLLPSVASAQATEAPRRTPVSTYAAGSLAGSVVTFGSALRLHFSSPPTIEQQSPAFRSWRGGLLFDEPFRGAVRIRDVDRQEIARVISDVTLFASMLHAAVIDALVVPLVQDDPDLAWQASAAHALALGLTLGVGEVIKRAAGRARPYERDCQGDPERPGCRDEDTYHSFYSLHTGMAFTSAGFSCAMHASRSLYGDGPADAVACASSVALATTTGLLRVLSDRHYLTDVLVGGVLGFLVGYFVPLAIVPERGSEHGGHSAGDRVTWALAPLIAPGALSAGGGSAGGGGGEVGLSVFGAF